MQHDFEQTSDPSPRGGGQLSLGSLCVAEWVAKIHNMASLVFRSKSAHKSKWLEKSVVRSKIMTFGIARQLSVDPGKVVGDVSDLIYPLSESLGQNCHSSIQDPWYSSVKRVLV